MKRHPVCSRLTSTEQLFSWLSSSHETQSIHLFNRILLFRQKKKTKREKVKSMRLERGARVQLLFDSFSFSANLRLCHNNNLFVESKSTTEYSQVVIS